jgi:hypothetical protein
MFFKNYFNKTPLTYKQKEINMKTIYIVVGVVAYFMDDHHGVRSMQVSKNFSVHEVKTNAERRVQSLTESINDAVEKERLTLEVLSCLTIFSPGYRKLDGQVRDILSFEIEEIIVED